MRFVAERYTITSTGRCEYKGVMFGNRGYFEADSTDEAITRLHDTMSCTTYILKVCTEKGYRPFYKVIKRKDGTICVLNDARKGLKR